MLKVNDKNNNVIDVILVSSLLALNIFKTYSTVSIVDIEQVIVAWVSKNKKVIIYENFGPNFLTPLCES